MRELKFSEELWIRFWAKVDIRDPDDCWPWKSTSVDGSGRPKMGYGWIGARVCYTLIYGAIPAGLKVLHNCDNGLCCNPRHLMLGTQLKNMQDAAKRGRMSPGERHYLSKLTMAAVVEIRLSGKSSAELAKRFGVGPRTIDRARAGETWKCCDAMFLPSTQ